MTDPHAEHDARHAGVVFGVALVIRLIVAAAFLGGADGINGIAFMRVAVNHVFINLPYFPLVPNWLGLAAVFDAGWLDVARLFHLRITDVPPGIFPKLLPCLADSLVATWFALDSRHGSRYRRVSSWVYATCPLPLVVVCMQGQWDSVWILFALAAIAIGTKSDVTANERRLAGALLSLGVLFKPVPIILLPLLFPKFRDRVSLSIWVREASSVVVGLLAVVAVFFLWFALEGIDVARNARFVLRYSTTGTGVVNFGLSHLSALSHSAGTLRDLAILLAVAVILQYHLTGRSKDPMVTAAIVLLVLPAVGGIGPQYLLWALPFMLAVGLLRYAVALGFIGTFVVLAYYLVGKDRPFLVPLRALRFLTVPDAATRWLDTTGPTAVWRPISNVVVPLALLLLAGLLLRPRSGEARHHTTPNSAMIRRSSAIALVMLGVFVAAAVVYVLGPYPGVAKRLNRFHVEQYHSYMPLGRHALHVGTGNWWLSALVLFPVLTLIWFVISWRYGQAAESPLVQSRDADGGPAQA